MAEIACPACGETDALAGTPNDDGTIALRCESCSQDWTRDPSPTCPVCGGRDLFAALRAIVEKSRGTQLSIVGTEVVHLCMACDAELVASYRTSRSPLMPDDLPTT